MLYLTGHKQPRMPLSGNPLSDEEIASIAGWIDQLPPISDAGNQVRGWPWTGLKAPEIPQVRQDQWVKNPIDAFILAKLESRKLTPASPASKRLLLRRLYFDLIGLPPTPEQMRRFTSDPRSRRIPAGNRPAASRPSLRRALGAALAGHCAVCRYRRGL